MTDAIHYFPFNNDDGTVTDVRGDLGNSPVLGYDNSTHFNYPDATGVTSVSVDELWGRAVDHSAGGERWLVPLWSGALDETYKLNTWSVTVRLRGTLPTGNFFVISQYQERADNVSLGRDYFEVEARSTGLRIDFAAQTPSGYVWFNQAVPQFWDGEWHRITVTGDGTTVSVYLDGNFVQSRNTPVRLSPKYHLVVGGMWSVFRDCYMQTWDVSAKTDDVGIWDRVITPEEITSLNVSPLVVPEPPSSPGILYHVSKKDTFDIWRQKFNLLGQNLDLFQSEVDQQILDGFEDVNDTLNAGPKTYYQASAPVAPININSVWVNSSTLMLSLWDGAAWVNISHPGWMTVTTTGVGKTLARNEFCVCTAPGITLTLPTAPVSGDKVGISVPVGAAASHVTVSRASGVNIQGINANLFINIDNTTVVLVFVAGQGWRIE